MAHKDAAKASALALTYSCFDAWGFCSEMIALSREQLFSAIGEMASTIHRLEYKVDALTEGEQLSRG